MNNYKYLEYSPGGIFFPVGLPKYGSQHLGISPLGAADNLSFTIAYLMLNQPINFNCFEIIVAPQIIKFTHNVLFCITGARFKNPKLASSLKSLEHATIYYANAGDSLSLGSCLFGFRSYLMITPADETASSIIGFSRGSLEQWFNPYLRVINFCQGPEYDYISNPQAITTNPWIIQPNSNNMGIRINGNKLLSDKYDIISAPVSNGTVQLTRSGPIVLLSQRQTTGGYPRVMQIGEESLNHLSQIPLLGRFKFNKITQQEAYLSNQQYKAQINKFKVYCEEISNRC